MKSCSSNNYRANLQLKKSQKKKKRRKRKVGMKPWLKRRKNFVKEKIL